MAIYCFKPFLGATKMPIWNYIITRLPEKGAFLSKSGTIAESLTTWGIDQINIIIIRCVFSSLSIGRESTTWPANNCLQIMVCSCVVPSKRVLLQIIFCSCVIGTTFSREKWQIASLSCQEVIKIWKQSWWSNDKTIIALCYHNWISWFGSVSQINYLPQPLASADNLSARHWQITIFCSTSSNDC